MNKIFVTFLLVLFLCLCVISAEKRRKNGVRSRRNRCNNCRQYIPRAKSENCIHDVCNNTNEYPEDYILELLQKNKKYSKLFGTVIEPTRKIVLGNRFNGGEEENMCRTMHVTTYPKSARFLGSDKMSYIVNVKEYTQVVSFETCIPNSSCFINSSIMGYRTFCKQEYNNVRLLYLDRNGTLAYGKFPIPSTCVCTYSNEAVDYEY